MPDVLQLKDINDVDQTAAQNKRTILANTWSAYNENIDTRTGAFDSLIVQPTALLLQFLDDNITKWENSTNIDNLGSADLDSYFLDRFAANYRITRKQGTYSTGTLEITVSALSDYFISRGFQFKCNGFIFNCAVATAAKRSATRVIQSTDQLLTKKNNGYYSFTVDVIAYDATTKTNLPAGTAFTAVNEIDNLVSITAFSSLSGGQETETDSELAQRVIDGVTPPILSGRAQMTSVLHNQTGINNILADSLIGAGDTEMTRDAHSVFPMSYGGKVDWYVRTDYQIQTVAKTLSATKQSTVATGGQYLTTWLLSIAKDVCPGFYAINQIQEQETAVAGLILSEIRDIDLTDSSLLTPIIPKASEGLFTAYQTSQIIFTTLTETEFSSTINVIVKFDTLSNISALQQFVNQADNQVFGGDILIKAPIPVRIILNFTIKTPSSSNIDTHKLAATICDVVNNTGFTSKLPESIIVNAIQNQLPNKSYIEAFMLMGRCDIPATKISDKNTIRVTNNDGLYISDPPTISNKTTCFFCSPSDISIIVANV